MPPDGEITRIARARRVDRIPLPAGERVPCILTLQRADFSRVVFTVAADVRALGEERAPPARFGGKTK